MTVHRHLSSPPEIPIRALHSIACDGGAGIEKLDPRDQARRLPPDRPARRTSACGCSRATVTTGPSRYPLIVEAALRNRNSSFVIDGEAVLLGVDGISDFNGLHSRQHDDEVAVLRLRHAGQRRRRHPQTAALACARPTSQRLLTRRIDGIHLAPFEQGEIGPELFHHACLMGLERLVSKHRDSVYRGGRFDRWVKVKNRAHHAFSRVRDQFG